LVAEKFSDICRPFREWQLPNSRRVVEKESAQMTIERYLRLIAGCFVLATLLLGYFHSPYWFLFTGFVAINLIQSAFSNWCPMMSFLRRLGAKSETGTNVGSTGE
jgi:hypothetical protein